VAPAMTSEPRSSPSDHEPSSGGERRLPLALLSATVLISTVVLAWHAWNSVATYLAVVRRAERDFDIHDLHGEIRHLDQALTDATLLATATGDLEWERRYRELEPDLRAAIQRASALSPGSTALSSAIIEVDAANEALVALEHRAFELVRSGQQKEADAILAGEAYRRQKQSYADGLAKMLAQMTDDVRQRSQALRRRAVWMLVSIAVPFPVLVLAWVLGVRSIRRHLSRQERTQRALRAARDGLEFRVAAHAATLRDTHDTLRREMDERRQLEEARQLTQFAIDHVAEAVFWVDPDGRFFAVNEAACRRTGYARDELLASAVSDLDPNFPAEAWPQRWEEFRQRGATTFETLVRTKSGYQVPVEITTTHMQYAGREFLCAFLRDLTSRKEAEEALRASNVKLAALAQEHQTLLDHTRDFLYRHDVSGHFNFLSRSVEQLTGYTVEEWYTHYTAYMTDNPVNEKVVQYTEETLRTGQEHEPYLVEIRHKSGRNIMLEVNERPYFEEGRVAGIIGVARDVTDRVRAAEATQKAREAAESASRAKSVFLANLSHEIRTPITAILGAAELSSGAYDRAAGGLDRRDVILRNGRHLLALLDGLLDVARLEAGKLTITPVDASLVEILTDVRAIVIPLHQNRNVRFELVCDTPIPERIHTDPTRLKQAVINLVENALKFVERGYVRVRVRVARSIPEPRLTIAVEDSGPGIPPAARERIFEAFAQLDPAAGGIARGVGLGLPLARAIAEKLGGSLHLDAGDAPGCTFTLRVPTGPLDDVSWIELTEQQSTTGRETPRESLAGRLRGRVLLAEDFSDTRELLRTALTQAGADVVAVATGREALAVAAQAPFDLIVLDIRMPELDGLSAAAELRRCGCCTALMAMTASAEPAECDELLRAGFDDVWPKPMSMDEFITRVAAYLATRPADDTSTAPSAVASRPPEDPRIRQAISEFARSLPDRVAEVRSAVMLGDSDRVGSVLHQLVGAAGIHGFLSISDQAAAVLSEARSGRLVPESTALSALASAAEAVAQSAGRHK
jgi:PAS domain S-box-containing protein